MTPIVEIFGIGCTSCLALVGMSLLFVRRWIDNLGNELNPKPKIYPYNGGVQFVGYKCPVCGRISKKNDNIMTEGPCKPVTCKKPDCEAADWPHLHVWCVSHEADYFMEPMS